ncbi:MAG: ABC transporter ATP-binding protein [Acidobacteriota bacterium]
METAVRTENLRKVYGSVVAVDDVSIEVREGEIFGVVGPNGAGKTTTIECLEGLRRADGGRIEVLGLDPVRGERELRQRIGVQLQQSALPARIKVWEALDLFASFYDHTVDWRALLDRLGLADKRSTAFAKLSGGQQQRLFIALALLNDPELIFLDELTTGLDPQARRSMWDLVRGIRDQGKTVVLTTHFMEEAERLCDRVAIMDQGRIVALDSPADLMRSHGAENRITFTADGGCEAKLQALAGVTRVDRADGRVIVHGSGDGLIGAVVNTLSANEFAFRDLRTEQATLEDVFLKLTGKEIRD